MTAYLKRNARFSTEYWMRLATVAMFGWTTTAEPLFAQTPPAPDPAQQVPAPADQAADVYSITDLQYLLGPIALYPDPLLALILPASAHLDQITEAARWLENNAAAVGRNDFTEVDAKPWDPSVQALTRFPDAIKLLSEHPDWTEIPGMGIFGSVQRHRRRHPDAAGESGERRKSQNHARAGRDDPGRRWLPCHLHRACQPRTHLCPGLRFLRRVRHRRDRRIGVRHGGSGWLRLE